MTMIIKNEVPKLVAEEIADYEQECKKLFNELITFAKSNEIAESKDFEKFERSLLEKLLKTGNMLSHLYFEKKKGISVKR